jgi:hypothetical protein
MAEVRYEGIVEGGKVRLPESVHLPEHARVIVIVPDADATPRYRIYSPRLAHPEQAIDFTKQVVEDDLDAGLRR